MFQRAKRRFQVKAASFQLSDVSFHRGRRIVQRKNAGFCIGRVLGLDLVASLQTGVATSGYYVRDAKSPALDALRKFLKML